MTCNHCVKHITAALRAVPGVTTVDISLADNRANVVHDVAQSPVASLIHAVESAGYHASIEG